MTDFTLLLPIAVGIISSLLTTFIAYLLLKRLEATKIQRTEKKLAYAKILQQMDEVRTTINDFHGFSIMEIKKPKNDDEARAAFMQLMSYPTIISNDDTMQILRDYTYGYDEDTSNQTNRTRKLDIKEFGNFLESIQPDLALELAHILTKQANNLGKLSYHLLALKIPTNVRNGLKSTAQLIQQRGLAITMTALAKAAKLPITEDFEEWNKQWTQEYEALKSAMEADLKSTL